MKKTIVYLSLAALCGGLIGIQACTKSLNGDLVFQRVLTTDVQVDYNNSDYPAHLQNSLEQNVNNEKAALGRVLFYDEVLSKNSRVSCGSCHLQSRGFSDVKATSEGFAMGQTARNSMAISNLMMGEWGLFWDLRASGLEEQVVMPILNHIEMGNSSISEVVDRIKARDYYPPLFENAYGSSDIDESKIALALREFIRALKSYESAFDEAGPNVNNGWGSNNLPDFEDPAQRAGFELFGDLGCANCHFGNNLGGLNSANIGLDEVYTDNGMNSWTGESADIGVFKIPSLRNVELTAPYMHDGRFKTLEEVVNHYNSGIKSHPNLDWRLVDMSAFDVDVTSLLELGLDPVIFVQDEDEDPAIEALFQNQRLPVRLNLSETDKSNLIAFLKTLTDEEFISDSRFSDPFENIEVK